MEAQEPVVEQQQEEQKPEEPVVEEKPVEETKKCPICGCLCNKKVLIGTCVAAACAIAGIVYVVAKKAKKSTK